MKTEKSFTYLEYLKRAAEIREANPDASWRDLQVIAPNGIFQPDNTPLPYRHQENFIFTPKGIRCIAEHYPEMVVYVDKLDGILRPVPPYSAYTNSVQLSGRTRCRPSDLGEVEVFTWENVYDDAGTAYDSEKNFFWVPIQELEDNYIQLEVDGDKGDPGDFDLKEGPDLDPVAASAAVA